MGSSLSRRRSDHNTLYATNGSDAERAQHELDPRPLTKPEQEAPMAIRLSTMARTLTRKPKKIKPKQFREDAHIWELYLEEAEEKAQDKAELWKTGLDSLLIFAGLFAGVVSSFLIDVRNDLQSDRGPRSYWIHGLWIISLFTTIFSAIMGVLAKAWLAKYTPAKNRRKAKDAYHRYNLDRQSERWYLKEALILAPLFVQIATGLFLAGLVLQALGDNVTIGRALLGLCVISGFGYFYLTIFPLRIPSSPFNTPLSELLHAVYARNSDVEDRSSFQPDIDDGLGEILYHKLIKSGRSPLIDGAIAEVALPGFAPIWIDFLCKSDTPTVVLSRFQECAISRSTDTAQRDESLGNHLLVLLSFAELYERQLERANQHWELYQRNTEGGTEAKLDAGGKATLDNLRNWNYGELDTALRDSLEPGKPLYSWNDLPDTVRPLLFALRANILILFKQPTVYMVTTRQAPSDFNLNELTDRPWEMAFQETPSGHRIHFMLAACGGLVQGEKNLKKISSFILSLSLAKASVTALGTGKTSEWTSSPADGGSESVSTVVVRYISRLYGETVNGWEDMAAAALRDVSPIDTLAEDTEPVREHTHIPRLLLQSLSQPSHSIQVHSHAVNMLNLYFKRGGPTLGLQLGKVLAVNSEARCITDITVYDEGLQDHGLTLLTELTNMEGKWRGTTAEVIRTALVASIHGGLKKRGNPPVLRATVQFIEKLAKSASDANLLIPVITEVIPALVSLSLDDFLGEDTREATVKPFQAFARAARARPVAKKAILEHLSQTLEKKDTRALSNFLRDLVDVAKQRRFPSDRERPPWAFLWKTPPRFLQEFLDDINFRRLVDAAISDDGFTPTSDRARKVLDLLSKLNDSPLLAGNFEAYHLTLDVVEWLTPLVSTSGGWLVRYRAVTVVRSFNKYVEATPTLLQHLVKAAMMDSDNDVRYASLQLLSSLVKEKVSAETVEQAIVGLVDSHEHFYKGWEFREREKWVLLLSEIAKHVSFPKAIAIIVPITINVAPDLGNPIRNFIPDVVAVLASDKFTIDPSYFSTLKECTPPDLAIVLLTLEPRHMWRTARCLELFAGLAVMPNLPVEVTEYLQGVVSSLRDSVLSNLSKMASAYDWEVRVALPRLLNALGVSLKSRLSTEDLTTLRDMASKDGDYDVRSEMIEFLSVLSSIEGQNIFSREPTSEDGGGMTASERTLQLFDTGIKNELSQLPRQSWLRFAPHHIKEDSSRVTLVLDVAIKDGNSLVRREATNALFQLLGDAQLRGPLAPRLGKSIASFLKNRDHYKSAGSLLVRLTLPPSTTNAAKDVSDPFLAMMQQDNKPYPLEELGDTMSPGHEAWIRAVMLLARNDFQGVPKIVEEAIKDEAGKDFQDLSATFEKVKLLSQIQANLPNCLDAALRETKADGRLEAVNLLSSLLSAYNDDHLLGSSNDTHPRLMSRLAEISLKDDDSRLRTSALKLLKSLLMHKSDRFQDSIGSSWSKPIAACLSGQGSPKYRINAIWVLFDLTLADVVVPGGNVQAQANNIVHHDEDLEASSSSYDSDDNASSESSDDSSSSEESYGEVLGPREHLDLNKAYATLNGIILPSVPMLLNLTLLTLDRGHESLRKVAEDILLNNLKAYPGGRTLNEEVLSAIPMMIPSITAEGKRIALHIIEILKVSDDKALSVAHALVPLLRNPSSFSRTIAVELLSALYRKYRPSKPRLIESAIQEVIALALDEKDNVGDLRKTAIQLLSALSEPLEVGNIEGATGSISTRTPIVKPTTQLATQFMGLLQNEDLRPSVVELLSLMATQVSVRNSISLQLMAAALGPDGDLLQGYTELLARLISDGRFADEPTDKVILLLASPMVTRPTLARYRYEILTALWCRYSTKVVAPNRVKSPLLGQADIQLEPKDKSTELLVKWFTFAMFGRHATAYEVKKCLERSSLWLPKLTPDSAEVVDEVVVEERRSPSVQLLRTAD